MPPKYTCLCPVNGRMGSDPHGKCHYEELESVAQESGTDCLGSNLACDTFLSFETQSTFLTLSEPAFSSGQSRQKQSGPEGDMVKKE